MLQYLHDLESEKNGVSPLHDVQPDRGSQRRPQGRKIPSLLFTEERESTSGHPEPEAPGDSQASTRWHTQGFQFNSNDRKKVELREACISVLSNPGVSPSHFLLQLGFHCVRPCSPSLTGRPSQWLHALCTAYILSSMAGVHRITFRPLASAEGYCLIRQHV